MEPEKSSTVKLEVRDDHWCFGCGRLNPTGLHLTFWHDEQSGTTFTDWTPEARHQGFPGIVHGGLVSTLLDEVMGWAISHQGIWAVTGKLDVTFRKPVEIGATTRVSARITGDRGRTLLLHGSVRRAADNVVLAEASAIFVRVPAERAAEWTARYLPA